MVFAPRLFSFFFFFFFLFLLLPVPRHVMQRGPFCRATVASLGLASCIHRFLGIGTSQWDGSWGKGGGGGETASFSPCSFPSSRQCMHTFRILSFVSGKKLLPRKKRGASVEEGWSSTNSRSPNHRHTVNTSCVYTSRTSDNKNSTSAMRRYAFASHRALF